MTAAQAAHERRIALSRRCTPARRRAAWYAYLTWLGHTVGA